MGDNKIVFSLNAWADAEVTKAGGDSEDEKKDDL